MIKNRFFSLLVAALCLVGTLVPALAIQVDCDATYCFTQEDFSPEEPLRGICVVGLPQPESGTVMLGNRVIRQGDILTADQVEKMTFSPLRTETDREATVTYLPIYENRVAKATSVTIGVLGKEDLAPIARDFTMETYKNLPNEGKLRASDPEGEALTFTLVRKPRRGEVELKDDGSFTYTPKKNKVGVDSFTYTAADPAGKVSQEATVTVTILKPTDAQQYTDTVGQDCRFAAEWMRNTGLFVGEQIDAQNCYFPDKAVGRGEFLAMMVKALDVPTREAALEEVPEGTPNWLKPYYAAALRCGLLAGLPEDCDFSQDLPITGGEAAVMLQNALELDYTPAQDADADIPQWAAVSVAAMADNGIQLEAANGLNRGQVAKILYQATKLAETAPGTMVMKLQN